MKNIIPLVASTSGPDDIERWVQSINAVLPASYEIRALKDVARDERENAHVAVVANPDPDDLAQLPNLKWVHSLWAGVERMMQTLPDSDLKIVRMVDPTMARVMSEAVLTWTLYLHRHMPLYARQQKEKVWYQEEVKLAEERTVTVLGLGQLGTVATKRLKENGFNVQGWSRTLKEIPGIPTFSGPEGLSEALSNADITVLLVPLTDETRGLIAKNTLASMKPGACLINFARGPIINDTDLLASLDNGHLSHAVLDVFATEPLPKEHPYWTHSSVTVLPHISAPTIRSSASRIVATNLQAYFENGTIPVHVDRSRGY